MDFNIISDKREVAGIAVKNDPEVRQIDELDAAEAYMWIDNAIKSREGIAKVLKYLFCRLHKGIQRSGQ